MLLHFQISIIDPSLLVEELNLIEKDNSFDFPFSPNIENIHLWRKVIIVKAYVTYETLNFILEIRLISPNTNQLLHLYSIPNKNNTILIPTYPFLILGNNEFAYPSERCTEITNDRVICKHLNWEDLQLSKVCIAQLLHQDPQNCTYVVAYFNNNIIQQIQDNNWIIIMKKEEVVKTSCDSNIQH